MDVQCTIVNFEMVEGDRQGKVDGESAVPLCNWLSIVHLSLQWYYGTTMGWHSFMASDHFPFQSHIQQYSMNNEAIIMTPLK
jgi:hypothetical protein